MTKIILFCSVALFKASEDPNIFDLNNHWTIYLKDQYSSRESVIVQDRLVDPRTKANGSEKELFKQCYPYFRPFTSNQKYKFDGLAVEWVNGQRVYKKKDCMLYARSSKELKEGTGILSFLAQFTHPHPVPFFLSSCTKGKRA